MRPPQAVPPRLMVSDCTAGGTLTVPSACVGAVLAGWHVAHE
jgi:hypothetical protein